MKIIIRDSDQESHHQALCLLIGRFSFKTWANGEILVPEAATEALAAEGIPFSIVGRPTYGQLLPTTIDWPLENHDH